ncbi:MAG: hypothetical protein WCR02_08140 [Sphaerochaetaceae bacterium]
MILVVRIQVARRIKDNEKYKDAGVIMPEVHLFPASEGPGYFATKGFDCEESERYHRHTACGLLQIESC